MQRIVKAALAAMLITVLIFCVITAYADNSFMLYDCRTDSEYRVSTVAGMTRIQGNGRSLDIPSDTPVSCGCVCGNMLILISNSYDDATGLKIISYICDLGTSEVKSYVMPAGYSILGYQITCDSDGALYVYDRYDRQSITVFRGMDIIETYRLNDYACQLMCLDGHAVLIFCDNSVVLISDGSIEELRSVSPAMPVEYTGKGTITDSNGITYTYRNKSLSASSDTTTLSTRSTLTSASDTEPKAQPYIDSGVLVLNFGITVSSIKSMTGTDKGNVKVLKSNGTELKSGYLGTGMTVYAGNDCFTVAVKGDLTGEGNINSRDLRLVMKYITKAEACDRLHLLAGDLNSDGKISTKDLLALSHLVD